MSEFLESIGIKKEETPENRIEVPMSTEFKLPKKLEEKMVHFADNGFDYKAGHLESMYDGYTQAVEDLWPLVEALKEIQGLPCGNCWRGEETTHERARKALDEVLGE